MGQLSVNFEPGQPPLSGQDQPVFDRFFLVMFDGRIGAILPNNIYNKNMGCLLSLVV